MLLQTDTGMLTLDSSSIKSSWHQTFVGYKSACFLQELVPQLTILQAGAHVGV